jgi:transposase
VGAPVGNYRTSVGLDVHARSVVACGLDRSTGEVLERRLTPDHCEILDWIGSLPDPAVVTYEAGPTGFGLARALRAAGIGCVVAAPSKLQRPAGDRVKTDAHDAPAPGSAVASGRNRGSDDALGGAGSRQGLGPGPRRLPRGSDGRPAPVVETASAQGNVYYGGNAWTTRHEAWLRTHRFTIRGLQLAYDTPSTPCWPPWIAATASMPRSPRWPPIRYSPRW